MLYNIIFSTVASRIISAYLDFRDHCHETYDPAISARPDMGWNILFLKKLPNQEPSKNNVHLNSLQKDAFSDGLREHML